MSHKIELIFSQIEMQSFLEKRDYIVTEVQYVGEAYRHGSSFISTDLTKWIAYKPEDATKPDTLLNYETYFNLEYVFGKEFKKSLLNL